MSSARQHAERRRLVDVSGPFLSIPVLTESFPEGLRVTVGEHRETLAPDLVLANPGRGAALVLVQVFASGTDLERPLAASR